MENVEVDPSDASCVVGHLMWHRSAIAVLPESFGDLTIGGDLFLNNNQLTSLPAGFGSLTVGGTLFLGENELTSLPEGFGSLTVGGGLRLSNNDVDRPSFSQRWLLRHVSFFATHGALMALVFGLLHRRRWINGRVVPMEERHRLVPRRFRPAEVTWSHAAV